MRKGLPKLLAVILAAVLMPAAIARAQAAPAGAAPRAGGAAADKPGIIGALAVRSLDALQPLSKDLGIPLPPFLTAAGLEGQFPFLGADSVDGSKPIGLVFFGGPGVDMNTAVAFQIPLKAGADPLKALNDPAAGGKPMEGHPDTIVANNFAFRRAKESFMFGAQPALVATMDEKLLAGVVAGKDSLAAGWIDVAAARRLMPEQFKAFIEQMEAQGAAKDPDEQKGAEIFISFVRDKLNRIELAVDQNSAGLRVAATIRPFGVKAGGAPLPRPGMPAGVVARVDAGFRMLDVFPIDQAFWEKSIAEGKDGKIIPPDLRKQMAGTMDRLMKLMLGADSISLGVEPAAAADAAIVYAVSQYRAAIEFDKQLRQSIKEIKDFQAMEKDPQKLKDETKFELSDYTEGATKVTRLTIVDPKEGTTIHFDSAQKGNAVYMTFAKEPTKLVAKLAEAKPDAAAPAGGLAGGYIDLGGIAKAMAGAPNSPLAGMPEADRKKIIDLLNGQKLNFSVTSQGDGMTFDLTVPQELLKRVPELTKIAQ